MYQLNTILLAVIGIQWGMVHAMECENGWVHFDDSCYWFARNSAASYTEAEHYCRQKNSHLVTVETNRENLFIKDFLRALKAEYHWMGYRDEEVEGLWVWDSTHESGTFTDWNPGEPNQRDSEDCAAFSYTGDFRWIDAACNARLEPLCEMTSQDTHVEVIG